MAQWYNTVTASGKLKSELNSSRQGIDMAVFSNTGTGVCELWRRAPDFTIASGGNTIEATPNDTETIATGSNTVTFADANPDTIVRTSGDFTTKFTAGQVITVAGSTLNDGTYTIVTCVTLTLTLTTTTDVLVAETMSTGNLVITALYDTLSLASSSWANFGVVAGMSLAIDNTTTNLNEGT